MLTLSDVESRLPALRRVFSRAGVVAAYLHGSLAEGCPGPGSDVDFAVLLPRRLSRARMDALCARLSVDIGRVLDCANVGVQALNPTGYYFQYRVTTTGICIYARDPDEAADYQAWAAKRWCDFQWYQNIFDEAVRESIEGATLGVDPRILRDRLRLLQDCVSDLRDLGSRGVEDPAASRHLQRALERNAQLAVEACFDMASHVLARTAGAAPATYAGYAEALLEAGIIPESAAETLRGFASLRNTMVHAYPRVGLEELWDFARSQLGFFREFAATIEAVIEQEQQRGA